MMVVVNPMPYEWTSPTHDAYKAIFEEAVAPLGPERFEAGLWEFCLHVGERQRVCERLNTRLIFLLLYLLSSSLVQNAMRVTHQ